MIWVLLLSILVAYGAGYCTCYFVGSTMASRKYTVTKRPMVEPLITPGQWKTLTSKADQSDLVRRVTDLERARHEVD